MTTRTPQTGADLTPLPTHHPTGPAAPARGPWSVRLTHQRGARAALEVYEQGELLDVMVASALSPDLLRGARHCELSDGRSGFAWGRLTAAVGHPRVTFTTGRLKRLHLPTEVLPLAGEFWLAWAEGQCDGVQVELPTGAVERLRTRRI
ncbi:hypothetical protein ABT095_10315 [Kitasatospora sp. NPDC002227]|uniref:hypothetical protein n=1 Tax=Kitasatospora sp. NPDC002227 TaxID=3154773 RepID=UPI00332DA66E